MITGTLADQTDLQAALNGKANTADLAAVATSGAYADLTGKPRYSANVGDGVATAIAVTHGLGTRDVTVSLRGSVDNCMVITDWVATDPNTITLSFALPPAASAYRVTVTG